MDPNPQITVPLLEQPSCRQDSKLFRMSLDASSSLPNRAAAERDPNSVSISSSSLDSASPILFVLSCQSCQCGCLLVVCRVNDSSRERAVEDWSSAVTRACPSQWMILEAILHWQHLDRLHGHSVPTIYVSRFSKIQNPRVSLVECFLSRVTSLSIFAPRQQQGLLCDPLFPRVLLDSVSQVSTSEFSCFILLFAIL